MEPKMYTLTELIKDGKMEIKDKAGVSIANIEKQMLMRDYHTSIVLLKELRSPELINVIKSWPGTPEKYAIEEIIKDIETRHPKRKLVLSIEESKIIEGYLEAEPILLEEKGKEWIHVPSALPGFFVPGDEQELTLKDEITRTAEYIGTKCFPDMYEKEIIPDKYELSKFRILKTRHACDRADADLEVEITKKKGTVKYNSVQDYWDAEITPNLLNDKIAPAIKKLLLAEFIRNFSICYAGQLDDINIQKVRKAAHTLQDLLQKAIQEPEKYDMKEKISVINLNKEKLETNDEKIKNARAVYAKGLIENITIDWKLLGDLYRHDYASKFEEGIPFKIETNAELVYES